MPLSSGLYPDAATWATGVTLMPMSTKESPVAPETSMSVLSSPVGVEGRLMPFLVLINVSQIQDTDLEDDMLSRSSKRRYAFLWTGNISPLTIPIFYCPYTVSQAEGPGPSQHF